MASSNVPENIRTLQEDEVQVLEAVYGDDFEDLRKKDVWQVWRPAEFSILLCPSKEGVSADAQVYVSVRLHVKFTDGYPISMAPIIDLQDEKGLSKKDVEGLKQQVKEKAASFLGQAMICDLCQHIQEYLHTKNHPPDYQSFYEGMLKNQRRRQIMDEDVRKRLEEEQLERERLEMEAIETELRRRQEQRKQEALQRRMNKVKMVDFDVEPGGEEMSVRNSEFDGVGRGRSTSLPPTPVTSSMANTKEKGKSQKEVIRDDTETITFKVFGGARLTMPVHGQDCTIVVGAKISSMYRCHVDFFGVIEETGQSVIISEWCLKLKRNNAGKVIATTVTDDKVDSFSKELLALEQEFRGLVKLEHPHLLKYLSIYITDIRQSSAIDIFRLILLKSHSSSFYSVPMSHFLQRGISFSSDYLKSLAKDILSSLDYLHSRGTLHKDLNEDCIWDSGFGGGFFLSDFSIRKRISSLIDTYRDAIFDAQSLSDNVDDPSRNIVGVGKISRKSDIFMFGLCLLKLHIGLPAFYKLCGDGRTFIDLPTDESLLPLDDTLRNFIDKMITRDDEERWSCSKLLTHPYLIGGNLETGKGHVIGLKRAISTAENENNDDNDPFPHLALGGTTRLETEFEVLKLLGKGGFGDVMKVKNKLDDCVYAIKRVILNPKSKELNKKIIREVKLLSRLNHENVVRYYNSWIEQRMVEKVFEETTSSSGTATVASAVNTSRTKSPVRTSDQSPIKNKPDQKGKPKKNVLGFVEEDIEDMAPPPVTDVSEEWSVSYANDVESSSSSSDEDEDEIDGFGNLFYSKAELNLLDDMNQGNEEIEDMIEFGTGDSATKFESGAEKTKANLVGSPSQELWNIEEREKTALTDSVQILYIQMEYCEKNTLRQAIDNGELMDDRKRSWRLFREILEGLSYIHHQGMIHRDLKPVNVFLDINDHVKIGDFGLATKLLATLSGQDTAMAALEDISQSGAGDWANLSNDIQSELTTKIGTALYVSPELCPPPKNSLTPPATSKIAYTQKVDMYSLGIVFFEMFYRPLKTGMERIKLLTDLRRPEILLPPDFVNLLSNDKPMRIIRWLLQHDAERRPTADELLDSDLLPPLEMQPSEFQLTVKQILSNTQTHQYKWLINALLDDQHPTSVQEYVYDAEMYDLGQLAVVDSLLRKSVEEKLVDIFRTYGAICVDTPLLVPKSKIWTENAETRVDVMDRSGCVLHLSYDLRLPFARFAVRSQILNMKRYSISKVYRDEKRSSHPRQLTECAFDVVTSPNGCTVAMAELIALSSDVVSEFPAMKARNFTIRLNHTSLLKAIFIYSGIDDVSKLVPVLHLLGIDSSGTGGAEKMYKDKRYQKLKEDFNLTEKCIAQLVSFLQLEGPLSKISSVLRCITKRKDSPASSLAKEGLHELETIKNNAETLGATLPIMISLRLAYNLHEYDGPIFQVVSEWKRDNDRKVQGEKSVKKSMDTIVLAAGGRYDQLLDFFRKPIRALNAISSPNSRFAATGDSTLTQGAVGVSFAFDLMVQLINSTSARRKSIPFLNNINSRSIPVRTSGFSPYDVLVCSVGHKLMMKDKLGLVRSLRLAHLRADFLQDPVQNLEDLQESCLRLGVGYLIIVKEAEGGIGGPGSAAIRIRYWDRTQERAVEKKLSLSDVVPFVQEKRQEDSGSHREDSVGPGTSGVGTSSQYEPSADISSTMGITSNTGNISMSTNTLSNNLSNLRIHFAVLERPPHNMRKRYEGQIGNVLSPILQKFSPKETLDLVATDIPGSAVKQLAAMGEFNRDEASYRASISDVASRFNKYKKELRLVIDEICDLKFGQYDDRQVNRQSEVDSLLLWTAMADLEPVGVPGPEELRTLLTTCADPLSAIQEFQTKNSVQLFSLAPALKLLDLHNVRRLEFHEVVMNDLRERLLAKIKELGIQSSGQQGTPQQQKEAAKRLEELVGKSFKLIKASRLRPVALEALNSLPKVPKKYLQEIRDDPELYKDVAISVRQQIWKQNPNKFLEELRPLVTKYCDEKRQQMRQLDTLASIFYLESGKARRQTELIQRLSQMVGRHLKLYDQLLQYIREQFYETQNPHLCSLRAELLMALHDADVQELTSVDPCHKFAWCLDACLREKHLDSKHASEMRNVLDGVRSRTREQILGDLAMISGDPHAIHFFAQLILKVLHQCAASETLPRDHAALQLVLRLLNLGLWAWRLMKSSDFKEPKIDSIIYTKFLPALMTVMTEDTCRMQLEKLPDDDSIPEDMKANLVNRYAKPPGDVLTAFVKSEPICACLYSYYVFELGRKRDRFGLCRLAPTLRRTNGDWAYSEEFVSAMVYCLASFFLDNPHDELTWDAVMERFLLAKATAGDGQQCVTTRAQILRLLYFLASKFITAGKHESLMEKLKPQEIAGAETKEEDKRDQHDENDWYQRLYLRVEKRLVDVQTAASTVVVETQQSKPGGPGPMVQQQASFDFSMPPATPMSPFGFDLGDVPSPM